MAELKDTAALILESYNSLRKLTQRRLMAVLFLCDWRSCLVSGQPITNLTWTYESHGPDSERAMNHLLAQKTLFARSSNEGKEYIELIDKNFTPQLSAHERQVVDFVIDNTKSLDWPKFITLCNSTYPLASSDKFDELNLSKLVIEYKKQKLES